MDNVAVLGPGGVGGLLVAVLARAGATVTCLAGASTVAVLTEHGIRVCAPVHDALLIEAPLEEIDQRVAELQGNTNGPNC